MSTWKRNRLYLLRTGKRLTQHAVAAKLHVSQATYWKYETGLAEPDPDTKRALARALGVKVADLLEPGVVTPFTPCEVSTWPVLLKDEQVAAIFQIAVATLRKKCQKGTFVPAPIADLHPRRWRRVDVLRYVEGARGQALRGMQRVSA